MVAGPEVARVIGDFENADLHCNTTVEMCHHDQAASVQVYFAKDVRSLVTVIGELGNPFEEENQNLLLLDTKEIADPTAVETVCNAKSIGQEHFNAFTKECLIDRTSVSPVGRQNRQWRSEWRFGDFRHSAVANLAIRIGVIAASTKAWPAMGW